MKKQILIIYILLAFLFVSCVSSLEYKEGKHVRNEIYDRTFDIMSAERNNISFNFLKGEYTDDDMDSIVSIILNDIRLISSETDIIRIDKRLNIYFLDDFPDESFATSDSMFVRKSDILGTDTYRKHLLSAYLELEQKWKSEGLYKYMFDVPINADLKSHYENCSDMMILALTDIRFLHDWNTSEEIEIANDTAAALAGFVINEYGFPYLKEIETNEVSIEWLESIGIHREFEYDYEPEMFELNVTNDENSVQVISGNVIYHIEKTEDIMETSSDIEYFINKDINGRKFILDYLETGMDDFNAQDKLKMSLTYNIGEYTQNIGQINLGSVLRWHLPYAVIAYLSPDTDNHWQFGALAEYIGFMEYPYSYDRERFATNFKESAERIESGDLDIDSEDMMVLKIYLENGGRYNSPENVDVRLFCDASAYATLVMGEEWGSSWHRTPIYDLMNIHESARKPGDELSYAQACSFMAYLVGEYGFDNVMDYCSVDSDFPLSFGEEYEKIKAEWLVYLNEFSGLPVISSK